VLSTPLAVDIKGSKTTVQGDAKVIPVDYSNNASIKHVDVVISSVPEAGFDVQEKVAAAAKEADVKLFVPSEYGGVTDRETDEFHGAKANVQGQLRALGMPYAAFYTGPWADYAWVPYVPRNTSFGYSVHLTIGPKDFLPRRQERESISWWRWQQANYIHR